MLLLLDLALGALAMMVSLIPLRLRVGGSIPALGSSTTAIYRNGRKAIFPHERGKIALRPFLCIAVVERN